MHSPLIQNYAFVRNDRYVRRKLCECTPLQSPSVIILFPCTLPSSKTQTTKVSLSAQLTTCESCSAGSTYTRCKLGALAIFRSLQHSHTDNNRGIVIPKGQWIYKVVLWQRATYAWPEFSCTIAFWTVIRWTWSANGAWLHMPAAVGTASVRCSKTPWDFQRLSESEHWQPSRRFCTFCSLDKALPQLLVSHSHSHSQCLYCIL